jgi:hypothetical protein
MVATEGQRIENRNKPIMNLLQQAMMSANTERIRAETEGTKTQTRIAGSEEGRRASLYALGLPVQVAKNNQELAQYTALKELHDNPGPTVKALMTSLGIDPKDQKQLEPFYTRMLLTGNVNLLQMIAELQQRRDALNLEADKLNGKDKLKQISQLIDYGQEVGLPDEELAPLYNVYNKALVANSLPGVIFGGSGNQYSMDAEGNFSMGGASAGRAPFQISPEELQAAGEVTTKIMTLKREMKGGATTRPTTRPSTRPAAPQQTIGEAIVTDAQQAARKNLYDKMWTSLSLVKQNGDPVQIAWTRQLQEDDYIRGTNQVPNPWNVQNAAGEGTAFGSREMVLKTIAREKNWDESKALNFLTQLDDSSTEERDLISQFQSIRSNEKQQGRFYFMLRMLNSSKIDDKLGMMQDYIKKFDSDTKRRPSISPDDYEQIFKYGIRRKYWTKVDADLMVKMVEGKQGGK